MKSVNGTKEQFAVLGFSAAKQLFFFDQPIFQIPN